MHSTFYPFYVYCQNEEMQKGWAPQLLLHREQFGEYGVVLGLSRSNEDLNNTFSEAIILSVPILQYFDCLQ